MRDVIPAPVPGLDLRREYGHHQSPAIRAGGLIFCSGMVAINPESGEREHGTGDQSRHRAGASQKAIGSRQESGMISVDNSSIEFALV